MRTMGPHYLGLIRCACPVECWGPIHTWSQVLSPNYDTDAYKATLFGGEAWDLCCELSRDPALNPNPANIFSIKWSRSDFNDNNHIWVVAWGSQVEAFLPLCRESQTWLGLGDLGTRGWTGPWKRGGCEQVFLGIREISGICHYTAHVVLYGMHPNFNIV